MGRRRSIAELMSYGELQREQLKVNLRVHALLERSTCAGAAGNRADAWARLLDARLLIDEFRVEGSSRSVRPERHH